MPIYEIDTLAGKILINYDKTLPDISRKQKDKILDAIKKSEERISNENFLAKAPREIIDAEYKKLKELKAKL